MASRIILDPETLLAQAGEMQSLTAEYESLFSKVTGTLNDTNNNWSELLAHNFAGKISSAQQSFASITELLASGAAAAKNSATTMQSVDQSLFKVFGGEAGEGIISGQVQGMTDVIEDYRKWEKKSKKVKAKSKKKKDGFLDSLKADMAGVSKAIVKKGKKTVAKIKKSYDEKGFVYKALQYGKSAVKVGAGVVKIAGAVALVAGSGGAALPVAACITLSACNDIYNGMMDATYTYTGDYNKVGNTNALKDFLVKKGGETGEILFGDEKLGEKMGSWAYTGLDVVSFLNGVDKLGKSFGKLQTITSGTAETSKVWGYAKNSSSGYDGIVHLSLNTEDGDDSYIEWADGRTGENVKTQINGNQFTLTWDSTYRYDYDLGESEEGEGGKITGIFLITNRPNGGMDGGLSICVDGKWYPYVYDSTAYWNGELSDNLETDADVSSMSEDELGELKENQTAVSSGLMGAFKEQGLDSTKIDESTGTVQMDNNVLFAWDKADLSEEGKAYLDQFLAAYVPVISSAIEDGKVSTIVVEGYTDSAGDEAYNLKLSEERAKTVADYIKAGYPELTNAIEVVGNGANNLILDGEGKEDAAASRRVEVRYVLKTE